MKPRLAVPVPHSRHVGSLVLAGVLVFLVTCSAAQVLRTDLDWSRAPLSFYLLGEYGWFVKGAYFALGTALILLGVGYYRALGVTARRAAPVVLFASAGVALDVTALADSHTGGGRVSLEGVIHGLAASTAFLCVTVAMLLQAWLLRADALWRHRFTLAFGLAAASFIAMWTHALWREAPRGLTQKLVVVMILAWIAMAAWWLRNHRGEAATIVDDPDRVRDGERPLP